MNVPNHIAIILDGNGRWAKSKGMPRSYGHVVGCDNLEKMCNIICDMGVRYLTVYAFSTENWKRSQDEIKVLMNLFRRYLKRCERSARKNQMRVKIIGDPAGLDPDIQRSIHELEDMSKDYDRMFFQIALNYGGRDEILRGVTRLAEDARQGRLPEGKISEQVFESYLDTAGIPDPDLLIRTSGEQRLSNFLLWQLAYTEFYFTDVPWPAFNKQELVKAMEKYNERDRRYGGIKGADAEGGSLMFVTRLISGIVLVAAALLTIGLGNWVLFFTLLILSLIGCGELYKAMKVREQRFPACWSWQAMPALFCTM